MGQEGRGSAKSHPISSPSLVTIISHFAFGLSCTWSDSEGNFSSLQVTIRITRYKISSAFSRRNRTISSVRRGAGEGESDGVGRDFSCQLRNCANVHHGLGLAKTWALQKEEMIEFAEGKNCSKLILMT